jgi:hypothetical protein
VGGEGEERRTGRKTVAGGCKFGRRALTLAKSGPLQVKRNGLTAVVYYYLSLLMSSRLAASPQPSLGGDEPLHMHLAAALDCFTSPSHSRIQGILTWTVSSRRIPIENISVATCPLPPNSPPRAPKLRPTRPWISSKQWSTSWYAEYLTSPSCSQHHDEIYLLSATLLIRRSSPKQVITSKKSKKVAPRMAARKWL